MVKSRKRNSTVISEVSEVAEPPAVCRNIPEVFQIFHNAQYNSLHHKKYAKELRKVYRRIDEGAFKESFVNALNYAFMFGEANGNVDRVLQFVAAFAVALEDEGFLRFLFEAAFECVSVTGQGVRGRSCQLLGVLLGALGEEATLDDDICDRILAGQLERLQDVRGAVRCRAVLTLQRLQNPADEEDPVTKAYLFHMCSDPSPAVRRAVALNLAKSSRNLPHVLQRLCDVDETVRKAAFLYVASINVTQLKVRQRIHALKVGLIERSPRVRRVVETALVPNWLGAYDGDALRLLGAIRLDNLEGAKDSAAAAAALLQSLFKHRQKPELLEWLPIDPKMKLIPPERLNKESVKYWRHLVRHLHDENDTENLDEILPELVTFTEYVRVILETPYPPVDDVKEHTLRQNILHELMNMFPVYDMADEVGRKALQSLLYDALTGPFGHLDECIIKAIMRAIDIVIPDVKKRIDFVTGIISELHEPAEEPPEKPIVVVEESNEVKIMKAELRVSLNEALEEQEEAVRAQNFGLAAICKDKVDALHRKIEELSVKSTPVSQHIDQPAADVIKEKRDDPITLNKCLTILNLMLDSPQISSLTPVLRSLFQNFESMIYKNIEIRENALKTVALYSMMDEEFAKDHKAIFFTQFLEMENEKIIVAALKCVFDILCIHGLQTFNMDQSETVKEDSKRKSKISQDNSDDEDELDTFISPSTQDTIVQLFLRLMNSECAEYREIIVEGFCRLMMTNQLSSASLISHLILLWFNPATEEEDVLRQLLGTFFPLYACQVEDAQEQLEAAFLPTLTTLAKAPATSPLSEVELESVLKFLIGLTMPNVASGARNVHSNLCVKIMHTLEKGADESEYILCRALALLTPPKSINLCEDLLNSLKKLTNTISDKVSYRNISRFEASLCIAIDAMNQRPSEDPQMEKLSTIFEANVSTSTSIDRNSAAASIKAASIESAKDSCEENTDADTCSPVSTANSDSPSSVDLVAPSPKRMKSITASDIAKRAINRSTRTPRQSKKSVTIEPLVTPNTRSKRKTTESTPVPKPTPKTKPKAARQLNKISKIETPKPKPSQKATKGKPAAKPRAKKPIQPIDQDENSDSSGNASDSIIMDSSSESEDETVLHTICHEVDHDIAVMSDSSSDEEPNPRMKPQQKKKLPNVTIPPSSSDSSDGLFSSDEEVTKKPLKKRK